MRYILASASPRRKELLKQMGIEATVIPACGKESVGDEMPQEAVLRLSLQKAQEIAAQREDVPDEEVIIGADTVVALGNAVFGKPKDEEDAFRMLSALQGGTHQVYTGVTIIVRSGQENKICTFLEETLVSVYPMEEAELRRYIRTKEPFDKAGGYAVQGRFAMYIKEICGSYSNVVGLPVARLYQEMKMLGVI